MLPDAITGGGSGGASHLIMGLSKVGLISSAGFSRDRLICIGGNAGPAELQWSTDVTGANCIESVGPDGNVVPAVVDVREPELN